MTQENKSQANSNWLNIIVAVTIAVVALLGSFISKAQSEASAQSALAGNLEQEKYYQAIGRQISGEADFTNALGTEYQLWYRYNIQAAAAEQRGDLNAVKIYSGLRDAVERTSASGIFDAAYLDKKTAKVNIALYKADLYLQDLYLLEEQQQAASEVASAWDEKANTYGLQLTLLVVAGFLLGLALMTTARIPTFVFTTSGILSVVVISIWAYGVSLIPITARPPAAMQAFAEGASLGTQGRWDEALIRFDAAIAAAQAAGAEYPRAFLRRAEANAALKNFSNAIADFQVARANGLGNDPTLNSSLMAAYFQTGDFETAIAIGSQALDNAPDDLLLRQQFAMALLANGSVPKATQENNNLIARAMQQKEMQEKLGDNPAEIWWLLNNAAYQYDLFIEMLQTDNPVSANIEDKEGVRKAAEIFAGKLRGQVLTMKYGLTETTTVPVSASTQVGEPKFILSTTPDGKYTYKVGMKFNYSGLVENQVLTIVVYRNDIEDPSWGFSQVWTGQQAEGTFNLTLSPGFDNFYIVPIGIYTVDIYVNDKRMSQGEFTVGDAIDLDALITGAEVQCDPLNTDSFQGACDTAEDLDFTEWPDWSEWPEWSADDYIYYNCLFDPEGAYCGLLPEADSDGDSVPDFYDACPYDYGDWYNYGCPASAVIDSDGDGLSNFDDYCPFDFGFSENYGCPMPSEEDWDGDAVLDIDDYCPTQAGPFDNGGCPVTAPDSDGDYIPDDLDACPTEYGISEDGCPAPTTDDLDGDGTLDIDDLCPNETGPFDNSGCPVTEIDSDGDTVPDDYDLCPAEYGADADGCPMPTEDDTDGDGVPNVDDLCPDETGPFENGGCPISTADSDGDSIPDDYDLCPTEYGTDADGCPMPTADDFDGDGVLDIDDYCPDQPGPVENGGCPLTESDADGDGTPDISDDCPAEPGPADNFGCPVAGGDDTDSDGIPDIDDACPYDFGPPENSGCPDTDSDGDGTYDIYDACPYDFGPPENSGCPDTDSDGDGTYDIYDACPYDFGPPENGGCPAGGAADSDGDGIPDDSDYCPYDYGTDENGCPVDSDGDGVYDHYDACPYDYGTEPDGCPTPFAQIPITSPIGTAAITYPLLMALTLVLAFMLTRRV